MKMTDTQPPISNSNFTNNASFPTPFKDEEGYHFQYRNKPAIFSIRFLFFTIIAFLLTAALLLYIVLDKTNINIREFIIFLTGLISIQLFISGASFLLLCRQKIIINKKGISFNHFLLSRLPKHINWEDIATIRHVVILPHLKNRSAQALLIMPKLGSEHLMTFKAHGKDLYLEKNSPTTLCEAITKFYGPISDLHENERGKFVSLSATQDLGKEVGHVAYAAIFLAIVMMSISLTLTKGHPLSSPIQSVIYWGAFVITFIASCWYMRKAKQKIIIILVGFIMAGVATYAMMPLISELPRFLGQPSLQTFTLISQEGRTQRWQSISAPNLIVTSYGSASEWCYQSSTPVTRTFNVYHGPLGLISIDKKDFLSLLKKYGDCSLL